MEYKTSFSARLRIKLELAFSRIDGKSAIYSNQRPSNWFKDYLLCTHSIIRASVPLMQAAYERCQHLSEERRLLTSLASYYNKHIVEEMDHDKWLLDDLEEIGISNEMSLSQKPLQGVAELVGSQYYWIYHWHPVCLLGYISFLEGNPPTKEQINRLIQETKYPKLAFRTLLKHSDLDFRHRDELNTILDMLPLTEKHQHWITSNALYTANKIMEINEQI
ncbi:MAG TPA: hypothetical protein VH500_09150 [Nitrososphaeraceae archaeon]|jgi:hypothetical protein